MTSSRKVKLQDRGTPEPKPSRKVVLDELLRSLQDLVTNELAVDVPLDDVPSPIAAPVAAAQPVFESPPTLPEPKAPKAAAPAKGAAALPDPTATEANPRPERANRGIEPAAAAVVREPEPEPPDLIVEELVAEPVASPAEIAPTSAPDSRPAVAPAARTNRPAAVVKPETAKPASKSKPLELAIESGPILPAPECKPTGSAAVVEPQPAKPTPKSRPLELAIESDPAAPAPERKPAAPAAVVEPETRNSAGKSSLKPAIEPEAAAPPPERKAAAPAADPATTARPRRGRLGDTVVITPPRDIPPPPKAAPQRGGRQAVVETPVPAEGLQQQLPYLDVSPSPDGNTPDSSLLVEPDGEIPHLPVADKADPRTPSARGGAHTDHDLLAESEIEIPDLPSTGFMTASPAVPSPLDRAGSMATDGPDELPDLDDSAVPTTVPAKPTALSVVDDDTGPSDIPLLEDAIDLDEHIELATPKPPATANPTAPRPAGTDPRRLAIQLAARLNVDLRREGKPVLGSDVIAKLARLLEESLAKGAPNMENTRPKKL